MPPTAANEDAAILIVDDEPAILSGLRRTLYGSWVVHTAEGPAEALEIARRIPELAVVVSDMRMPVMDGATLLKEMRTIRPDATRVMLTGYTGVEAAVAAINEGAIYRFLWKPCEPEQLKACLRDAVDQYLLVTAERELLDRTLRGSIRALLETLSMANPLAFSRAERIRSRVLNLLEALGLDADWELEVAAMLSQLGAITLPPSVLRSLHAGDELRLAAREQVEQVPPRSVALLADVPRLERVREQILFQEQRFDGRGPVAYDVGGEAIPFGARLLRVATDVDALEARGVPPRDIVPELRSDPGRHDDAILDALERHLTTDAQNRPVEPLPLAELRVGMVLAADLLTEEGVMLCGRGQQLTDRTLARIHGWARSYVIVEPVPVYPADLELAGAG